MTSETYPSGKIVDTTYDAAGRVSSVKKRGGGNYVFSVTYAAQGAVGRMKLGNNLWDQTNFNNRLQPTEIALGPNGTALLTDPIDGGTMDLVYGYGTTNNNGNVLSQTINVGSTLIGSQT